MGGGGAPPQAQAIQSAPVPTPAPPVTASSAEVIQAEHDMVQQNLLKKSIKQTIRAGDTGGFNPAGANPANAPGPVSGFRGRF